MAELEPQQTPDDPIAHLHRMSTTAGVATSEYVAINSVAVAAAVLGFATSLAFLGTPFLAVGIAAILAGIIALVQIRRSNGTQGGIALAIVGMLLALGITGVVLAREAAQRKAHQAEVQQINAIIAQEGRFIMAGDYAKAYGLFNADFRKIWPIEKFTQIWQNQQDPVRGGGPLIQFEGNSIVNIRETGDSPAMAVTAIIVRYQKSKEAGRLTANLQKTDSGWVLSDLPEMFEPPRRR